MTDATPRSDASDRRLASRLVQHGDEEAFRLLYRRHTPAVYGLVVRMMGGPGPDVDDVVQDAWLRAVRGLPAFAWRSSLRTWITGIAVNRVREHFRRARRRRDDGDLADAPPPSMPPTDPGMRMDLEDALRALPEGYRAVLLLHDWEGYTHPEISERLEIAVGTSRSQLFHARRALRRMLGDGDDA